MKLRKSITTKKGDSGRTQLFSGQRVAKDSQRIDICGDIDELVSILGVARTYAKKTRTKSNILYVQRCLFVCAAELATTAARCKQLRNRITAQTLKTIDKKCQTLEAATGVPRSFIIPGGVRAPAHLDHARAVSRRCERKVVSLFKNKQIKNKYLVAWLNRLSDYLYLLARSEEKSPTPFKK